MKKTIVFGDTHGRDLWVYIVKKENPDKVIFIGDYLDSFDVPPIIQLSNLEKIIEYKKEKPEDVVLLFGNHDFHYLKCATSIGERYSGFQASQMFRYQILLEENLKLFDMCHNHNGILLSHAGISHDWLKLNKFYDLDPQIPVEDFVNDLFIYKPSRFCFDGRDPYGDDVDQSPIWIRPRSLMQSNKKSFLKKDYIQVVGHTTQNSIDIKGKSTGGKYFFIDTLGTSGEYLIIEGDEIKKGQITVMEMEYIKQGIELK